MASSGPHSAPTMIQLPSITPVAHDHRPVSRMPPSTGQPAARRRQGSRGQERARRERFVLGLRVEQRQHPVVQRIEADRPGARRASVRHSADGVEDRREVGLAGRRSGRVPAAR